MTENVENIMLTKGNVGDKRTQHKSKYMAGGKVGGGDNFSWPASVWPKNKVGTRAHCASFLDS